MANHPIFSDEKKDLFVYLLDKQREVAGDEQEDFQTALAIYQGTFEGQREGAHNPVLNPTVAKYLLTIIEIERIAGEVSTFRYKEDNRSESVTPVEGTPRFLIKNMRDAGVPYKEALEILATIQDHPVLTAHPTNTLDSQRLIVHQNYKNDLVRLDPRTNPEAIDNIVIGYLTSLNGQRLVADNKSVEEEVRDALTHAGNRWEGIEFIYGAFEKALKEYYPAEYRDGDLKLNLKISSWVGGDKDGNKSIDEQTTRKTILAHDAEARLKFTAAIDRIAGDLTLKTSGDDPFLKRIMDIVRDDKQPDEGRDLNLMDVAPIQEALASMLEDLSYQFANNSIRLFQRQIDCFGGTAGKLEYRENSVLLMEALDVLLKESVPGYEAYETPADKEELYTQILMGERPDINLNHHLRVQLKKLEDKKARGESLEKKENAFVTTFGRFELALLNPEIIENHVIAEATDNFQILGVEVIKKAVSQKLNDEGKTSTPHSLRLTPLYESPEDMAAIPARMDALLDNPAYQDSLEGQRVHFGFKKLFQAIKVAMSDTMRRGSLVGARIAIHRAIKKTQEVMVKCGVSPQIDFGGSQTDPMRDGGRAMGFKVKLYKLLSHGLKYTSQGIDLVHFMGGPATGPFCLANLVALGQGLFKDRYTPENPPLSRLSDQVDDILYEALPDIVKNYEDTFFNDPLTNELLEALDYNGITTAGNSSSRAKGRSDKIRIQDVRSISLTETFQHSQLVPGYLGCSVLKRNIYEKINTILDDSANQTELAKCLRVIASNHNHSKDEAFYSAALNFMFNRSPLMRDTMDRVGHSVACTNFETVWKSLFNEPLPAEEEINALKGENSLRGHLVRIMQDYRAGAAVSYAAQSGEPLQEVSIIGTEKKLETMYPHFQGYFVANDNVFPFLVEARKTFEELRQSENNDSSHSELTEERVVHAIGDGLIFSNPDAAKYLLSWANFLADHPEIQDQIQNNVGKAKEILVEAGLTDHQSGHEWYNTISKFLRVGRTV
jgi:phosphoenolpyruvate carboxylase